jgi:predicted urease superfamily metal-dependent hydrolase
MKINVKTRINYKGQEYSSVDELPPEVRSAYEKAVAAGSVSGNTKIVFNGTEYTSPEQMPAAERQLYEDAIKLAHDSGSALQIHQNASTALLTNRQWQMVLLFAVLLLIALIIFLLTR